MLSFKHEELGKTIDVMLSHVRDEPDDLLSGTGICWKQVVYVDMSDIW